jgi:hypothetical protein
MRLILAAALLAFAAPVAAQPPDPAAVETIQREARAKLSMMDGVWRGTAWTITQHGRHDVVHTERAGPFLGGALKVIEGRSYNPDGSVGFNAFGIISYEPTAKTYLLHSYAMGRAGDFPLQVLSDGYIWQVPAGPGTTIRYKATIADGKWREVGVRMAGAAAPVQIFEMNLTRVGDSKWPAANPVPMK